MLSSGVKRKANKKNHSFLGFLSSFSSSLYLVPLLMDKEPFCLEFALALIHFINYSIIVVGVSFYSLRQPSVYLINISTFERDLGENKIHCKRRTMPLVIKTNQNGYQVNP
jgi:hypothetical protein